MSWITDLLQDIPLSAVLREKLGLIEMKFQNAETKIASLELENANLTERIAILEIDNANLKNQIETLSHEPDLHKIEIQIITLLAQRSQTDEATIQHSLKVPYAATVHHVARLKEMGYVRPVKVGATDFPHCALTKKGRAFASDNHLIESPASPDAN